MQPRQIENATAWLNQESNIKAAASLIRECHESMLSIMPWFGMRVAKAKVNVTPYVNTAATDGKNIDINPLMVKLMTMEEIIFVLVHEVLHISLNHHTRRGDRDPVLWNMAGDYVIHCMLVAARIAGIKMPEGLLYDPRFDGMTTEKVYDILKGEQSKDDDDGTIVGPGIKNDDDPEGEEGHSEDQNEDQNEDHNEDHNSQEEGSSEEEGSEKESSEEEGSEEGEDEDLPGIDEDDTYELPKPDEWGGVEDAKNDDGTSLDDDAVKEEEQKVIEDNAMSGRFEKQAGKGSALFGEALEQELKKSEHNWKKELRKFMTYASTRSEDRTWNRVNRRAIARGELVQGFDKHGHGEIVIAGDASGSVSNEEFEIALAQVGKIINGLKPEKTHWIQFDGDILSHDVFTKGARFTDPKRSGYGGTLFSPVLDLIKKEKIKPTCIIVLTDMGLCDWHQLDDPKVPTLWVDVSGYGWKQEVKWGKTIKVSA